MNKKRLSIKNKMALQKTKTIKGFFCNYWRIIETNANFLRGDAVVTLALYKDQTARNEDQTAIIETISFDLGSDLNNSIYSGSDKVKDIKVQKAYQILKQKAIEESQKTPDGVNHVNTNLLWFRDAEDVI